MLKSKYFILYLFVCILSLGFIGSGIAFINEHKTFKGCLSSVTELKEQNISLKEKLRKIEESYLQLEDKNRQLETEIGDLNEFQTLRMESEKDKNQKMAGELKNSFEQRGKEYEALKEEYNLLQEAYSELLKEELTDSGPVQGRRRRELTPEQMENFMASARERTYEMMDNRIAQAKTDYEAGLLEEMKEASANLFSLQDKLRTASDEEREAIRAEIVDERRALSELYNEYNSYQWKSLGEEFGVKNVEEFVKQAQGLMQNRQFPGFGGEMPQRRNPTEQPAR